MTVKENNCDKFSLKKLKRTRFGGVTGAVFSKKKRCAHNAFDESQCRS